MRTFVTFLTRGVVCIVTVVVSVATTAAQAGGVGEMLMADASVRTAIEGIKTSEPQLLERQIALCEIPAPPFAEQKRGDAFGALLVELGLQNVRVDGVGNVIGERPGRAARPHVVISAHLDTVFPEGTNLAVSREGTMLKGPGIGDDCRGLAVLAGVARAMQEARIDTPGSVSFVATVGEEGLGDLRGVKELFATTMKDRVDAFVSIDGTGLGVTHVAVGSRRYRVAYTGPGGHSYGAFGIANPTHALGRAIARVAALKVPAEPKTTFNVGRVGGGTSVNSISEEAWMEVDLRSADRRALATLDAAFGAAVDAALAEENARWADRGKLSVDRKLVGDRPAGRTELSAPIVQAAINVTKALGKQATLDEGSTDANLPISLGIAAITIDGGGQGTGAHTLDERFDSTDSWIGTARALLLTLALAR